MAERGSEGSTATRQKDSFDFEAEFIGSLLQQGLFKYANLAIAEARTTYPGLTERIEVVEVSALLRQGKTQQVEDILNNKNLQTDMKAQAMLLQLAMTFDAMGNSEQAMTRYQQFLELNEGKEITDPDVLRYFVSAGLRLSLILRGQEEFEDAEKVLRLMIQTTDDAYLTRKFQLIAAQNRIDQALTLTGTSQDRALDAAFEYANDLLWGGTDNYFYMGVGIKAWGNLIQGNLEEALAILNQSKQKAIAAEKSLEEAGVPKSEYPRAVMRYVEGLIQWDQAKNALSGGDESASKKFAVRAAGNLYNTFLKYEGNEYGDRAALAFEDLKGWIKDSFGTELKMGAASPRVAELMFKRQLDLTKNLVREDGFDLAEEKLLSGLQTYPSTKYTLTAYDTLSKIWIAQNKDWELVALTSQIAENYRDNETAANIMLRVGKKMADDENLIGVEKVLGAFGRNFPSHPSAPGMLFRIGKAASERGEQGLALEVYNDVLELYPQSNFAVRVLQLQAEEALRAENYEAAISAYAQVRDQARDPLQAAFARLRIADSQLASGDPELENAAIAELTGLKEDLEEKDSIFNDPANREQTLDFLRNVRYRTSQILLRKASRENSDDLRSQAAQVMNAFLEEFPDTPQSPDVMYNLGRLYLQQGQFEKATSTFDALSRQYPESDAGKDALYSLVRAAIEEDQLQVAREAVQKMVSQPEAYEIEKIYQVAQLMRENELWSEARDSFKLVLQSPRTKENPSMQQRALNGMGESSMGAGDLDAAEESFQELIDTYPTSTLVMEAGVSLSSLYLQKDPPEPSQAREALKAVSRILRSRPDKSGKARMDIALGHIHMVEGDPGAALANWYSVGLTQPDSEESGALVREAIELSLTQAQEEVKAGKENRWNLIIELTDQYLNNFPMDKKAGEMRSLNLRAIGEAPEE